MVKNSIKVYARLKTGKANKKSTGSYEITRRKNHENIVFNYNCLSDKKQKHKFRFHKIFEQASTQADIFEVVAKPVVNSVINGYNGTILAYGQTGSGKTYSITGSPNNYNNRGVIPRSIQQIFEYINSSPDKYSVHISYLEIYNEIGYDLLNPKQPASHLEDLPRVVLLEDGKGESHLRNLSILPATSEQDAMRLLFLGDTNRTIAETPVNEYSSRSHCIFTIYLSCRNVSTSKVRKCKLHLVDLAGSERIHKTNISGVTLNEAKHINLSLHYLEQVIFALSQRKRQHIPYRNSMMTYMLRDSLSGNSMTSMLTTMCISVENIEETLSTCQFAQRVAMVNTEAKINEEVDAQEEINSLKSEILELRDKLNLVKDLDISLELSAKQKEDCKKYVDNFLNDSTSIPIASKLPQIQFCFDLLRTAVLKEKSKCTNSNVVTKVDEPIEERVEKIEESIIEINDELEEHENGLSPGKLRSLESLLPSQNDRISFKKFISISENRTELDSFYQLLDKKYECAKIVATTIEECQQNIMRIRQKMEVLNEESSQNLEEINDSNCQLMFYQNIYRETILQLQNLKNEIEHLKHGLKQAEIRLVQKFKSNTESTKPRKKSAMIYDDKIFDVLQDLDAESSLSISRSLPLVQAAKMDLISKAKLSNSCDGILKKNPIIQNVMPDIRYSFRSPAHLYQNYSQKMSGMNQNFANYYGIRSETLSSSDSETNSSVSAETKVILKPSPNLEVKQNLDQYVVEKTKSNIDVYSANLDKSNDKNSKVSGNEKNIQPAEEEPVIQNSPCKDHQDSKEFLDYMKTIPLTGDPDVDDEIFNFYRSKFKK